MTRRIALVSGYFNPLHVGHVRMIQEAKSLADMLIVIVNNDKQQLLKKGRIIINEADRVEVVGALKAVDQVVLCIDDDPFVRDTLSRIREDYPQDTLIFANGGDRRDPGSVGEAERCKELGISIVFGIGGHNKSDASSRIIAELEGNDANR